MSEVNQRCQHSAAFHQRVRTALREYADTAHWSRAGSRFHSFSIVGRAMDIVVVFAV